MILCHFTASSYTGKMWYLRLAKKVEDMTSDSGNDRSILLSQKQAEVPQLIRHRNSAVAVLNNTNSWFSSSKRMCWGEHTSEDVASLWSGGSNHHKIPTSRKTTSQLQVRRKHIRILKDNKVPTSSLFESILFIILSRIY